MDKYLTITEQNMRLITAYHQINDEGRDVLDMVLQKLAEIQWPEGAKRKKYANQHKGVSQRKTLWELSLLRR